MNTDSGPSLSAWFYNSAEAHARLRRERAHAIGTAIARVPQRILRLLGRGRARLGALGPRAAHLG